MPQKAEWQRLYLWSSAMFLTEKIKCFATKKGVPPVVMKRRSLLKASPFLISSAMMFMACSQSPTPKDKDDWQGIYQQITDLHDSLNVGHTIDFNEAALMNDTNFNHQPESIENFWEIVQDGLKITQQIQADPTLNKEQKLDYIKTAVKMMKQIKKEEGSHDINLKDPAVLRTFVYFEEVVKFQNSYDEIFTKKTGWMDVRNDFLGRNYLELEKLLEMSQQDTGIRQFAKALYNSTDRFLINEQDSAMANALSIEMLNDWLSEQNIKDKNLWYYDSVKKYEDNGENDHPLNELKYWYKRGNKLGNFLGVDASGYLGRGLCSPVGVNIIHELQHAMDAPVVSGESAADNRLDVPQNTVRAFDCAEEMAELGPTLETLARTDLIYKKIHHIPLGHTVDYGTFIAIGKSKVPLGEIAHWTEKQMDKYHGQCMSKILMKPDVFKQLSAWGNGHYVHPSLSNAAHAAEL